MSSSIVMRNVGIVMGNVGIVMRDVGTVMRNVGIVMRIPNHCLGFILHANFRKMKILLKTTKS